MQAARGGLETYSGDLASSWKRNGPDMVDSSSSVYGACTHTHTHYYCVRARPGAKPKTRNGRQVIQGEKGRWATWLQRDGADNKYGGWPRRGCRLGVDCDVRESGWRRLAQVGRGLGEGPTELPDDDDTSPAAHDEQPNPIIVRPMAPPTGEREEGVRIGRGRGRGRGRGEAWEGDGQEG